MGKYSNKEIQHLLDNLDPLDVLELIDYHPESIRREGNLVRAFCPLSQTRADRYLTVDMTTKEFRSEPPDMPPQSGNIIDLFARARRMNLNAAVEMLADEFGILLMDALKDQNTDVVMREATSLVNKAAGDGSDSSHAMLNEAEKRFQRALASDPENVEALEGLFRVRVRETDMLGLREVVRRLLKIYRSAGRDGDIITVARESLEAQPVDLEVRKELAEALQRSGESDEAVREWMMLGSQAEESGMLPDAMNAYRRARQTVGSGREAHSRILNLLLRQGLKKEVIKEIQARVSELKAENRYREASEEAGEALKFAADDDDVRIQVIDLAILSGLDEDKMIRCLALVEEMRAARRLDRAAEALILLSAEKPDDTDILDKLIEIHGQLGQEEFVEGLTLRLAEVHLQRKDYPRAAAILEQKIENNAQDGAAMELLAEIRQAEGQTPEAIDLLRKAVDAHLVYMDEERALVVIQRICAINPTEWGDREREVDLLWALGRREAAEAHLVRLVDELTHANEDMRVVDALENHLRRDPGHLEAIKNLFRACHEKGLVDRAERLVAEQLAKLDGDEPVSPEVGELLVDFLAVDGGNVSLHEGLIRYYLAQDDRKNARIRLLALAEVHAANGRDTERADLFRDMVSIFPDDLEVQQLLQAACAASGDQEGARNAARKQVELRILASDYTGALKVAETAIEQDPKDLGMLECLVTIYEKLGKKVEELASKDRLAALYAERGDKPAALRILRELMVRDGESVSTVERLVELLSEEGNEEELLPLCRRAIDLTKDDRQRAVDLLGRVRDRMPGFLELRFLLMELLRKSGRRDEMADEMQSTIELLESSENSDRLIELYGQLLGIRRDNQMARQRLVELLRSEGRIAEAVEQQVLLAEHLREEKKLEEANEIYERIYSDLPDDEEVLRSHAALLEEMGDSASALRKMRQLATTLGDRGQRDEAVLLLRELVRREPQDASIRRTIIDLLRQAQRFEEAADELDALAQVLAGAGDLRGAVSARREAVALLPNSLDFRQMLVQELEAGGLKVEARSEQLALADALSRQGQPQKALRLIDVLLEDTPSSLPTRQLRAQIYDSMGDEKRALAEYREMQKFSEQPAATLQVATPLPVEGETEEQFRGLQIMAEYDFDNFIVGGRNNFAYATAKAVANNPGRSHNPFFLYSDVGLGKTHLLHAIANALRAKQPDIRIVYASTEYFTSALIDAIQRNTVTQFRNRHRKADLLLLDDVQFLAGKERSQEEFFHIFNILHQDARQIVVTSDRPPKDIAHLDMRIRTRFSQGVIVDIQSPDVETRMAILRAEAQRRGIDVPNDAITVIAERVSSNVRELKGAFNQLLTQHELCGDPLDSDTALRIVDKLFAT